MKKRIQVFFLLAVFLLMTACAGGGTAAGPAETDKTEAEAVPDIGGQGETVETEEDSTAVEEAVGAQALTSEAGASGTAAKAAEYAEAGAAGTAAKAAEYAEAGAAGTSAKAAEYAEAGAAGIAANAVEYAEADAAGTTAKAAEYADAEADAAENAGKSSGGKPWIDSDLKVNIRDNMELSPTDDFHLYVNYDWLRKSEIPSGSRSYSSFVEVYNEINRKALEMLKDDSLTGHDISLVQSMFKAALDWNSRNAEGMDPVMETVEDIRGIDSMEALDAFICDPERSFFTDTFLYLGNSSYPDDSSRYMCFIWNDQLLMEDAEEYSNRTEYGNRCYEALLYKATNLLSRIGYTEEEAQSMFEKTIDLETRIAEHSMTSAEKMSPEYDQRINNHYTPESIEELSPDYPLAERIAGYGYGEADGFQIPEPDVVKCINDLYTKDNLEAIKDYMIIRYVFGMAPYLDRTAYDISVETSNMVNGAVGQEADEKAAYDVVRKLLTGPMDRAYVERYDPSETREQITEICREVIDAYRVMLREEDWLSEETKAKAIEKLNSIRINAVYPDKWVDYSGPDLEGLSYLECYEAASLFAEELDKSHINEKIDKDIWQYDILETNAAYFPDDNSINIFLGILDNPVYYEGISKEELLGKIGIAIGHEISHAFDTSGAQYDKDGNLSDWWTEEDYSAFKKRAEKMIAYYDGITVWEGQNILGANLQTEVIADIAGMKAILYIVEEIEDFDYEEFFTAYAQLWRRLNTRELEYYYITQDPHPLHYLRTNVTVQQFDQFIETFGVKEGDGMYLDPKDRINVW